MRKGGESTGGNRLLTSTENRAIQPPRNVCYKYGNLHAKHSKNDRNLQIQIHRSRRTDRRTAGLEHGCGRANGVQRYLRQHLNAHVQPLRAAVFGCRHDVVLPVRRSTGNISCACEFAARAAGWLLRRHQPAKHSRPDAASELSGSSRQSKYQPNGQLVGDWRTFGRLQEFP